MPETYQGTMTTAVYDADADNLVDVAEGIRETGGPTTLTAGAVTDGQVVTRNGTTYAGLNRAGIDTDATTHAAAVLGTAHTGTLAQLNAGISDTSLTPRVWIPSYAGSTNFKTGGDDTQDATSGIYAFEKNAGDLGDATTCDLGVTNAGKITVSLTGDEAADREFYLIRYLDDLGFPDLRHATSVAVFTPIHFTSLGTVANDTLSMGVGNTDWHTGEPTEWALASMTYSGGVRKAQITGRYNSATVANLSGGVTNWNASGMLTVRAHGGTVHGGFFEAGGPEVGTPARVEGDQSWVRAGGANAPYLIYRIVARSGGGNVAFTMEPPRVVIS